MRKIYSFFAVAAVLASAAACQKALPSQEEQVPAVEDPIMYEGETEVVTFSVNVTDQVGVKSISDGLSATELEYAVYRAEDYVANDGSEYKAGQYIPVLSQGANATIQKVSDRNWLVTLTLVKNVKYDIVFWAYAKGAPYKFDESKAQIIVTDEYKGKANAEMRDAFFCRCEDYSVINGDTKVELRRPFAQINFGSSDYVPYVTDLGLDVTSTIDTKQHAKEEAVYLSDNKTLVVPARPAVAKTLVPTVLNVLDDSVSGGVELQFALNAIPFNTGDKVLLIVEPVKDSDDANDSSETEDSVNDVTYYWVSMNYILAPAERAVIDNIRATFNYNGENLVFDVPNVPYRRNFKTNILGDLFTGPAKFNVVVMPEYAGSYIHGFDDEAVVENEQVGEDDADNA